MDGARQRLRSSSVSPAHGLVLASASPRRAELLRSIGVEFDAAPADIDEAVRAGESPSDYVGRLALEKARHAARHAPGRFVLGADTTVVVDGAILGKPAGRDEAVAMLRQLAGRRHEVLTGMCLLGPDGSARQAVATTGVSFSPLSDADIDAYVATGEPLDKAGAYAIQGGASRFVTRVDGSYSNVVGLPLEVVSAWCREAGIRVS